MKNVSSVIESPPGAKPREGALNDTAIRPSASGPLAHGSAPLAVWEDRVCAMNHRVHETDDFEWAAEIMALPVVQEASNGVLTCNSPAEELLRSAGPHGLDDAIAALVRVPRSNEGLREALRRARDGERVMFPQRNHGPWRVVLSPRSTGLRAIAVPASLESNARLRLRASAADLIAGVSHEVANALGAVIGWTQLAQMQRDEREVRSALDRIEYSAKAAHSAARIMLDSVRGHKRPSGPILLNAIIGDVGRLLQPELRAKDIEFRTQASEDCWIIGSRSHLFTIVWNIAYNGVQAMEHGGNLSVEAAHAGDTVCVRIQDTGPGIAVVPPDRVFEPYFTTKEQGTGLGLPLVKRTVEQLGGEVTVSSNPGRGACFVVSLPAAPQGARQASAQRADLLLDEALPSASLAGRTILVVDDDDDVRDMLTTLLELDGASVTTASTARQALAGEAVFDLACVDVTLGDGSGTEVASELQKLGLVKHVVLVSGVPTLDEAMLARVDGWLRKPFEPEELRRVLREILDT